MQREPQDFFYERAVYNASHCIIRQMEIGEDGYDFPSVYFIGLVLAILAVLDIIKKPISLVGKIISCVLVLITSWVGLVVYYLYAKNHLTEWFK